MFETGDRRDAPAELNIDQLDWRGMGDGRAEDTGWAVRSAQFAVQSVALGVRFEVFDRKGDQIGGGWRPTLSAAKRAAKRRIRRKAKRSTRQPG